VPLPIIEMSPPGYSLSSASRLATLSLIRVELFHTAGMSVLESK
jgi:hypothetical protein